MLVSELRKPAAFWIVASLVLVPLFALSLRYTVPSEDAVILFEYAKNLAHHGVITYGGSTAPIEGATDFAWMAAIAAFSRTPLSEFGGSLVLSLIAAAVMAAAFRRVTDRYILLGGLLVTPFLYASLSGFSAIFFSAILVVAVALMLDGSRLLYPCLLLLCLVRPDGVMWGAGCVLYSLWQLRERSRPSIAAELKALVLGLVIPALLYFVWRSWYFGEWVPLPFMVKSTANRSVLFFRTLSIQTELLVAAPVIFVLLALGRRKDAALFTALFGIPMAFYAALWLEQNIGNRFMAPLFFASLYLFARLIGARAAIAFTAAAAFLNAGITFETANTLIDSRQEIVSKISRDLSALQGRMLVTEAGRLAYYSHWFVEDSWGLNTPKFAHQPVAYDDIAAGRYDLIVAHCGLGMLDAPPDTARRTARSWDNQCAAITSFANANHSRVFVVPFLHGKTAFERAKALISKRANDQAPDCRRYDIYAIGAESANADAIQAILQKYGGLPYSSTLVKQDGDIICIAR